LSNNSNGSSKSACPNCGQINLEIFHRTGDVPSNSCILLDNRAEALAYPCGKIELGFCPQCNFVGNIAFDPVLTEYSGRYEETQGFSPTFSKFHKDLAQRLTDRFDLKEKTILEIGCGKGEFLLLLCAHGQNRGLGFDPAYRPDRHAPAAGESVEFIRDFYSEKYTDKAADFLCCKMTLEHIPQTLEFMSMVRRAIGDQPTQVFFMIPDTIRILRDCAYEDIYYEHCSYFTPSSLENLFRAAGFRPTALASEYDGQYLTIAAEPGPTSDSQSVGTGSLADPAETAQLQAWVENFPKLFARQVEYWRGIVGDLHAAGKRTVLWGSGSKGVSFLTTLGLQDEISGAVDINPHRQGYYMPATGHRILSPDDLIDLKPDCVIVMNPIYKEEIAADLKARSLSPRILTVADGTNDQGSPS